jgi:hypothetical protein
MVAGFFLLRFTRKNTMTPAMMASTAMPPTTPPAMAPTFECDVSLDEPLLPVEELVSAFAVEVLEEAAATTLIEVASLPSGSGKC